MPGENKPEDQGEETTVTEKSLLAAVDGGIESANASTRFARPADNPGDKAPEDPAPEAKGEKETEGDDPPAGEEDPGDGSAAASPDAGESGDEQPPAGSTDDGEKPKEKAADAEPDKPAEKPAEKAPEAEKKARPSDEFGDLPEDVPAKTRERFDKLREGFDDLHERFTKADENNRIWQETIKDTGATPDQFGLSLEYLKLVNSEDRGDLEQAYSIMEAELNALASMLGRSGPGVNPLKQHPDLEKEVDDGYITEERALELAQARSASKLDEQRQKMRQQQGESQKATDDAITQIGDLGKSLAAKDPNFNAKAPQLKAIIKAVIRSGAPATKWVEAIKEAYSELAEPAAKAPEPAPTKAPDAPDSIRPGANISSTEHQSKPGSTLEAVNRALGMG